MLTSNDLDRLAVELDMSENFDPDIWADKERLSDDALHAIAKVFRKSSNAGVSAAGIGLAAFMLGWEAHKQYGRPNKNASITGGS